MNQYKLFGYKRLKYMLNMFMCPSLWAFLCALRLRFYQNRLFHMDNRSARMIVLPVNENTFIETIYIYYIDVISRQLSVNHNLQIDTVGYTAAQSHHLAAHNAVAPTHEFILDYYITYLSNVCRELMFTTLVNWSVTDTVISYVLCYRDITLCRPEKLNWHLVIVKLWHIFMMNMDMNMFPLCSW